MERGLMTYHCERCGKNSFHAGGRPVCGFCGKLSARTEEFVQTKIDWTKPVLRRQSTDCGEPVALRNATEAETQASRTAGPEGYIEVDGVVCYVEE